MKTYTDEQLKRVLAKMLPNKVFIGLDETLCWHEYNEQPAYPVADTELPFLCSLVEQTLPGVGYARRLLEVVLPQLTGVIVGLNAGYAMDILRATWKQRVVALAEEKGVGIT